MEPNQESAIVEMTCMEVRSLSTDYLEGSLGLGTYVRVDAHLDHCRHCCAIYDGIRNVVAMLGSDDFFPVPRGLDERLRDVLAGDSDAENGVI